MTETFRADLHCHTTASDGSLSPVELVALAKKIGLSALCITDHDTIDAYATAAVAAKEMGILLGTGVEFSCMHQKESVHVLAYDFPLSSVEIKELCERHKLRRAERNRAILEKLARLGRPVSGERLDLLEGVVGRPHIAQLMMEKGYVRSIQEAFNLYLGEGKPAYVAGAFFSVTETLEVIHKAGGKAFLAHPHLIVRQKIVKELLKEAFDGIECYYSKIPPIQEKRWLEICREKGWLISGGSDFHGAWKPHIPLGCSWVDEATFQKIFTKTC